VGFYVFVFLFFFFFFFFARKQNARPWFGRCNSDAMMTTDMVTRVQHELVGNVNNESVTR